MILTKEHLKQYFSMTDEQVEEEVERLKKAKRHDELFVVNKPTDQNRIDTLVAMAGIPYYWVNHVDQRVTCNKGPVPEVRK